ncbi:MAG: M20/M25/M40 family metallo-hydrolase [Thermoanaerobaculia bacterium]|nr:M20/M25/M40 family metallo-hydrolase [Thermoanaerobaculia bacterium]
MKISTVQVPKSSAQVEHPALDAISRRRLRATVEELAYPRHYVANREANERARDWLVAELGDFGYRVSLQGEFDNVVADPAGGSAESIVLLGAHYDTVPTTPGADDNNSAIAVCLEAARVLGQHGGPPVRVVIFNREEDGLLGSSEYVDSLSADQRSRISETHIFEMVGYYRREKGSQRKPGNLPIPLPDVGDFVGILSNSDSNRVASGVLRSAKRVGSSVPLLSLKVFLGIETHFGDLLRSDHSPFWAAGMPALMWTDTSEFRNPNYHRETDTPETLDYDALADVARLIVGHVLLAA